MATIGTYEILSVIIGYANSFRNYRMLTTDEYPEESYEVLDGAEYGLFHLAWQVCEQNDFDFHSALSYFGVDVHTAKAIISKVAPKPMRNGNEYYNGYNLICFIVSDIEYHVATANNARDALTRCWYQGMAAGLSIILCELCEVLGVDMLEELNKIKDVLGEEEIYTHFGEAYSVYAQ